jgi:hypothetical protein
LFNAKQKFADIRRASVVKNGRKIQDDFCKYCAIDGGNARPSSKDTCLDFGLQCLLPLGLAHAVFALLSDLSAQIRERGLQPLLRRLQGGGLREGAGRCGR